MSFDEGLVTPEDIRRWYEQAIDAGVDEKALNEALQKVMKSAGGTIEGVAQLWTEENELARLRAAWYEQLHGRPVMPPLSSLAEPEEEHLRRLVEKYPGLARETLRRMPPP